VKSENTCNFIAHSKIKKVLIKRIWTKYEEKKIEDGALNFCMGCINFVEREGIKNKL